MVPDHTSADEQLVRFERRMPAHPMPGSPPVIEGPGPQTYLMTYVHLLFRRRWTILAALFVITSLAAIAVFKSTPIYESTAAVEVESEAPQIESLNDLYQQLPSGQEYLRTQSQILESDNLAWRTVEQLRLGEDPRFYPQVPGQPVDPQKRKMRLIRDFKRSLSVHVVPVSRVIEVSFDSADPALAAKVANTLVENYIDYSFREKYDATRQASARMEQQLDELKAKVEKSQQALVDYQREHSIVDVNDKQSVVEQRLSELSTQLTTAQSDRIQKESLYNQVQLDPERASATVPDDLLNKLQERYADLKRQYAEALSQYGPAFPKVVTLQRQVEEYERQIDKERSRTIDRIRNDYLAAVNRERLLTKAVSSQKADLGEFNKLLVQQNILKGEFETNQQLYQRLLQHLKDATVSAGLKSSNIHVVDAALVPSEPIRPRKLLDITAAAFIGLSLGILLAFLQENMDHSIKSLEDVETLLPVPALGMVPIGQRRSPRQLRTVANSSRPSLALTVIRDPKSSLAEAYRSLRTSMLLSTDNPPQMILVSSSRPGEGKTTTAINLAMALAQQEGSVLLVDCDLRKPSVASTLGLTPPIGFSEVLTGAASLESAIVSFPASPNLNVLASGAIPPNPAELLASNAIPALLQKMRNSFKHIVIDSPPLLVVTDATIMSTLVDGVLLVAESGVTPKKAVVRACSMLYNAGAKILGVVLNKVDLRLDGYYGYGYGTYYRHYGYYHEEPHR